MYLSEILKDWPCTVSGSIGIFIRGVTERSGEVEEGYIFVARKGTSEDGLMHVQEAVERGAVAVVIDRNASKNDDRLEDLPVITVPDGREFLSYASAKLAGDPSEALTVIAVTGTNGKTTVTHFIGQLLTMLGKRAAIIGTTGLFIEGRKELTELPEMTTLPAEFLHPLLKRCMEEGMQYVVMEASSLGLSNARLDHCKIDIGVFLNIGVDHYEEHGSKQAYLSAKKKLAKLADLIVVNADDEQCMALVRDCGKPIFYFNEWSAVGKFVPEPYNPVTLPGRHNRLNALAAASVLELLGYPLADVLPLCSRLQLPEGRLQRIEEAGVTVFIDYAHTPDALETVLSSLTIENSSSLITVFGCGGDRDHGKRPLMGQVAASFSSRVIITSDNPRHEDPIAIIQEVLAGVGSMEGKVVVEPDRRTAIRHAVQCAQQGDIVLIAGKGHEKTQQIGNEFLPFSDYDVAYEALCEKKLC